MTAFKDKLAEFRQGLTRLNDREPLTPLSLAIIILFDLCVLSIVFAGLASHTEQLTSPDEYMPRVAREALITKTWSRVDRLAELQDLVLQDHNRFEYAYRPILDSRKIADMHPRGRELYAKIKLIADDKELMRSFVERRELALELGKLRRDHTLASNVYNTTTLQQAVGGPSAAEVMPTVDARVSDRRTHYEAHHAALIELDRRIDGHAHVKELWRVLAPADAALRERTARDLRGYELRYKCIEFVWQMLFLLPLTVVIYLWYGRSLRRSNRVQALIASHLMIVALIPVLWKLVDLVIELIPKYLLKQLFELLETLHIIALWHYLLIVLAVLSALLLVYLVQKKIFSPENLRGQRMEKGQCCDCGRKMPAPGLRSCPYCGQAQYRTCTGCGQETYKAAKYCVQCGHEYMR